MAKIKPSDAHDRLTFDKQLLDVYLTGLQAEVEAKLRRVNRFREQLQNLHAADARKRSEAAQARDLVRQIEEMIETNLLVRETLHELLDAARTLAADLEESSS